MRKPETWLPWFVDPETVTIIPVQSVFRTDPHESRIVFHETGYPVVGESISFGYFFKVIVLCVSNARHETSVKDQKGENSEFHGRVR